MLFITTLLICSFCFVVFLIWNQFLKKDTSLYLGLKVLQKKMNLLEDFSQKTDQQLRQGINLLDQKNQDLEKIVKEARFCIFKMEKLTHNFEYTRKNSSIQRKSKISLLKDEHISDPPVKKKKLTIIEEDKKETPYLAARFQFGESPFAHLNFVEHPATNKRKSNTPSDEEPPSPQP